MNEGSSNTNNNNNGEGEIVDEDTISDALFTAESNAHNVEVLATVYDRLSMFEDIFGNGFEDNDVCNEINEINKLIQKFRSLMFNGKNGACRIFQGTCYQNRDLSSYLCQEHMEELTQQEGGTREKSATIVAVERMIHEDRELQHARFLAMTSDQPDVDYEASDMLNDDVFDTPRRNNRNPLIQYKVQEEGVRGGASETVLCPIYGV